MRYSVVLSAAFAATALGSPMKRELIIETDTATDIDYVTDIVTVTAGQSLPTTVAAQAVTSEAAAAASPFSHWGHHHHHDSASASAVTSTVVAAPSSASVESSSAAPAPSSSAEAPSSYSAPAAPSSSSEAAPSSSAAPAPSSAPASSAPASSSSASATSAAAGALETTYQQVVVDHHNFHRTNHSAPVLAWNSTLATIAAQIASSCNYGHNVQAGGGGYGQNIAAGYGPSDVGKIITEQFYNSEMENFASLYGQANPDMSNFENWGHFSQVVWQGTESVGCATQYCSTLTNGGTLKYFTVCNYGPPGNYAGEYGSNIGQPQGQPLIFGNYSVATSITGS